MKEEKRTQCFGNPMADRLFLQPVDAHDLEEMDSELPALKKLDRQHDWCVLAYRIGDWNQELTPWKNAPLFGKEDFGDGAPATLSAIMADVIPDFEKAYPNPARKIFLGGYSLAGLFSLWASFQTDRFAGIAAVSPSVWYPGWIDYAKNHVPLTSAIYLSLGDREEKTRNRTMAAVGDAIRRQYELLRDGGCSCTLEWNPGNHFAENGLRMARGIAWLGENIP